MGAQPSTDDIDLTKIELKEEFGKEIKVMAEKWGNEPGCATLLFLSFCYQTSFKPGLMKMDFAVKEMAEELMIAKLLQDVVVTEDLNKETEDLNKETEVPEKHLGPTEGCIICDILKIKKVSGEPEVCTLFKDGAKFTFTNYEDMINFVNEMNK